MRDRPWAGISLVALVAAFAVHRVDTFDFWYHLAGGRLMVETGAWPRVNTFAFTTPDYRWIDLHWSFQLLMYAAYRLGGPAACTLLSAGCFIATALILFRLARRWVGDGTAALLVAMAVTVASPRLMPRPEMLSFLLLAVYLAILEGYPANGRRVWWLVPLQILWANAQGIFPIGLVVIGGYWAGATLARLPVPTGWRQASAVPPDAWRRLTLVLGAATLGCVVNPYGLEGALFPLELFTSATGGALVSGRIGELRGPFEAGHALVLSAMWLGLVIVTAGSVVVSVRRLHLGRTLVAAAFAVLAAQAVRNMALFAWVAVPVVAAGIGTWRDVRRSGVARALDVVAPVVVMLLAATVATNHFSRLVDSRREFGLGVAERRFPVAAVDFLERIGIGGRPFNCLAMGGYVLWRRSEPDARQAVFVDGRLETYGHHVFRTYFRAIDDPKTFARLNATYQPDFVIMYHAWRNRLPLVTYLAAGHGWTMVYYDDNAAIFLPDGEAHRELREDAERVFRDIRVARRRRPDPTPVSWWRRLVAFPIAERWYQHRYGEFLREMRLWPEAVGAYERALAADPALIETRFFLGLARWRTGDHTGAVAEWREVLRRAPDFAPAARALADAEAGA